MVRLQNLFHFQQHCQFLQYGQFLENILKQIESFKIENTFFECVTTVARDEEDLLDLQVCLSAMPGIIHPTLIRLLMDNALDPS